MVPKERNIEHQNKMITKEEIFLLIKNSSKFTHAIRAGRIMKKLAEILHEDQLIWELVGLAHDIDFDETKNNGEKHGIITVKKLKGKLPEEALIAIAAHDHRTGVKSETKLSQSLRGVDALVMYLELLKEKKIPITSETMKKEMDKCLEAKPWLKEMIDNCVKIGVTKEEFINLAVEIEKR